MPMTPEEYANKELNVPGYTGDEPVYAPDGNPTQFDPNILRVLNDGAASEPETDPRLLTMATEYNFDLPLELRRAEVASERAKNIHLSAKANFWNSLTFAVILIPILAFIAVLVK